MAEGLMIDGLMRLKGYIKNQLKSLKPIHNV